MELRRFLQNLAIFSAILCGVVSGNVLYGFLTFGGLLLISAIALGLFGWLSTVLWES